MFPYKLAHFLYIGSSWGHFSHICMRGENTTLVRAHMGTIYLPKAKPFINPLSEYLLSTYYVLDTVLQIPVIYSSIFSKYVFPGKAIERVYSAQHESSSRQLPRALMKASAFSLLAHHCIFIPCFIPSFTTFGFLE